MAVMKHVGLNVAADSFMYAAMTGMEAGLVIVTADDPAMHSSQNEQDNRTFAKFGRIPCLEPSDSQEAKDMVPAAFELSEKFDTPVLLRLTTTPDAASLRVSDDGVGFDLDQVRKGRFGLIGLNERARLLSGQLSLKTSLGAGTCVEVVVPLLPPSFDQTEY